MIIDPLKPNSQIVMLCHKGLTYNFQFLTLSPKRQSARMSEIGDGRLGLYGTEHLKCNHLMTLD